MLKHRNHKIKTDHKDNADQVDLSLEDLSDHHRTLQQLHHHLPLRHLPEIPVLLPLQEILTRPLQQEDQAGIGKVFPAKRIINSQFASAVEANLHID